MRSLADVIDSEYLEALGTIRTWEQKLIPLTTLSRLKEAKSREALISLISEGEIGNLSELSQDELDAHFVDKLIYLKRLVPDVITPFAIRYDLSFFKGAIRKKIRGKDFGGERNYRTIVLEQEKILRDVEESRFSFLKTLLEEKEIEIIRKAIEAFSKGAINEVEMEAFIDRAYLEYYIEATTKLSDSAALFAIIEADRFNLSLLFRLKDYAEKDMLVSQSTIKFPLEKESDLKNIARDLLSSEIYSSTFCSSLEKIQDIASLYELFEEELLNWATLFSLGNFGSANIYSYIYRKQYEVFKVKQSVASLV